MRSEKQWCTCTLCINKSGTSRGRLVNRKTRYRHIASQKHLSNVIDTAGLLRNNLEDDEWIHNQQNQVNIFPADEYDHNQNLNLDKDEQKEENLNQCINDVNITSDDELINDFSFLNFSQEMNADVEQDERQQSLNHDVSTNVFGLDIDFRSGRPKKGCITHVFLLIA